MSAVRKKEEAFTRQDMGFQKTTYNRLPPNHLKLVDTLHHAKLGRQNFLKMRHADVWNNPSLVSTTPRSWNAFLKLQ